MIKKIPGVELQRRMERFCSKMDQTQPSWKMVVIFGKTNQYYFTGTMQDGMLIILRDAPSQYWVRRSYDRAIAESEFSFIRPMESYRDAAIDVGKVPSEVYFETEVVPFAMIQRFQKYFPFEAIKSADAQIGAVRAVKSDFEIALMRASGKIHEKVLEQRIPSILKEGMSEAELASQMYSILMEEGHHGIARFGMFDTQLLLGHVCFGESSIYPTFFNGPGGNYGMSAAVPGFGSKETKLKKGDLVFVDVGCGVDGYHTDKTMTYMFGKPLPKEVQRIHQECVDLQNRIASMLKPGAIPADIYNRVMNNLSQDFLKNFMGFGERKVKFLGHGIGLNIDESPVIANGFQEPLQEGMVLAIEPKKGIEGVGMVGIENTFIVTPNGGECITGNHAGLLPVYE